MHIDFLINRFKTKPNDIFMIWNDQSYKYSWLVERFQYWQKEFDSMSILPGMVVGLKGDFSPESTALLLALIDRSCIIAPFVENMKQDRYEKLKEIAELEYEIIMTAHSEISVTKKTDVKACHDLFLKIVDIKKPGILLFTSGSSGQPKAALHDFSKLLKKFEKQGKPFCILNFLIFDHWGGLNTLLHIISSLGTVVTLNNRQPDEVCHAIQNYRVEILPASPTFLNFLLLSESYKKYDLSSLKFITYGTEPMSATTLSRLNESFPEVKLQQTYGLIELGVLRSKSKDSQSLWVKIGGEGYDTRVSDGLLEIKAESAMLGYLNADSPFTNDGWFRTGDAVEVDGDYFRILGRKSEIINVGGEKVFPQEVENVIQEAGNVSEVTVRGEKHPFTGQIVCAQVRLSSPEEAKVAKQRIRRHCLSKLEKFKVPVKILFTEDGQMNDRMKKKRY
jgi:long-chain acyl-CoA synthetase